MMARLPARSSTRSALARRCSRTPCAFCSTARALTPRKPPRTYVMRHDPTRFQPAGGARSTRRVHSRCHECQSFWGAHKKCVTCFFTKNPKLTRLPVVSASLSPAARHGGWRFHRRDDGTSGRLLTFRNVTIAVLDEYRSSWYAREGRGKRRFTLLFEDVLLEKNRDYFVLHLIFFR